MKKHTAFWIAVNAMIAALYTVLTLGVPWISFGTPQVRLSEALCILPVFAPFTVVGLTVGCVLTNLLGSLMGFTVLLDVLFGSLATFAAAVCTYLIGKNIKNRKLVYLFAPLPAVIWNMIIVGGFELTLFILQNGKVWENMFWVGIGQMLACYALGVPLMIVLDRSKAVKKLFSQE